MRFHAAAVLILLSESAVATPSVPNTHRAVANTYRPPPVTRPAHLPETASSRWRRVSDRMIERVWGTKKHSDCDKLPTKTAERKKRPASPQTQPATLPAHTLARYGGDVLLRFNISTAVEAKSLADAADTLLLDVWEFAHDWLDVRLAKELVPSLLGLLPQSLQHSHRPLLRERELAQAIFDTYPTPPREQKQDGPASYEPQHHQQQQRPLLHSSEVRATGAETNIFFSDYQPLSVITPWLRLLSSLFTTHVRLLSIGTSSEGRDIPALRIGVHPTNAETPLPKRKTVLLTAGLHAREWIATSTSLYIAYTLITSYGKNAQITKLLEDFDFVVIPTLNPDGYEYTWSTDRLWRKTRQSTSLRFCAGMDLDHSFNYSFPVGSAGNPCSEAYAGESAFQAVESRALADWALNQTSTREFVGLLDLHSYSQQILYPYSYSCAASPPGLEDLEELAYGLEKAIRLAHGGHVYEVLQACEGNTVAAAASASASASSTPSSSSSSSSKKEILPRMESSGGSLLDYFYATLRVRYAYQIKLRDRGTYGFLLPRENIVPTGREMVDAVLYFGSFLSDLYAAAAAAAAGDEAASSVVVVEEEVKEPAAGDELTAAVDEADEPWVMVEDLGGVEDGQEVQYELRRMRRRR